MGACWFEDKAFGNGVEKAFKTATSQALWDYGHAGYTGTIAEKGSYAVVKTPPRYSSDTLLSWVINPERAPDKYKEWARKAHKISDDKWGDCVAFKAPPAETKAYKESHGLKGKHGDLWIFCGWASS